MSTATLPEARGGYFPHRKLKTTGLEGIPQMPSGGGCRTAPMSYWPSPRMSMKDLRSKLSCVARRRTGLSARAALMAAPLWPWRLPEKPARK